MQYIVILSQRVFFYLTRGLVNNINISNMAAVIMLQIKNDAGAGCHKFHEASCHKFVRVCMRVSKHHSDITIHHWKLCTCIFILKENV